MGKIIEKVRKQREAAGKRAAQRLGDEFWLKVAAALEEDRMKPPPSYILMPTEATPYRPWWRFWK